MPRLIAFLLLALGLGLALGGILRHPPADGGFDLDRLGRQPVYEGGRLKPLDTVARTTLLLLRQKQTALDASDPDRRTTVPALRWLTDVAFAPERAATAYRVFRVDNPDLLGLLQEREKAKEHFTYAELQPFLPELDRQARRVAPEAAQRTPFERAVLQLRSGLALYQALAASFRPPGLAEPVAAFYEQYRAGAAAGLTALNQQQAGQPHDAALLEKFLTASQHLQDMRQGASLLTIPPAPGAPPDTLWRNSGEALFETVHTGALDPVALSYGLLSDARTAGDPAAFSAALDRLETALTERLGDGYRARLGFESFLNRFAPFTAALQLYVLVALVALTSWLVWPQTLGRTAFWLLLGTLLLHTFGLGARVYLTGYAPVTNLYSSAVFVGWGAALVSLFLERLFRNGIGSVVAAAVGFCSLLVAHHLAAAASGDTMEMMRAVLDSNFWLTVHVITVTMGYSATFLAGFLALLYVLRGLLTRTLDEATAAALVRMVYGVLCFALLLSFFGTVSGGIWADQSWGRFWGWDPKENGALMIVLWNALILHAWRHRLIRPRGLMLLALGGNIITSWSWFGTNMLGIGLHSYGFMDQAFFWLMAFWVSQILLILAGALPAPFWRSRAAAP